MKRRFFAILLFALASGISAARAEDFASRFVTPGTPAAAPMVSFIDAQSRVLNLRDFRGRYVLLNLWATWCGPCVREMASLNTLQGKFDGKKLSVLALTEDHDGLVAAEAFYKRYGLQSLQVFVDTSGAAPSILHVRGLPTTVFIDPNGMEIGRIEGDADWDDPETIAFLEKRMTRATK